MDVAVRQHLVHEARILENEERLGEAICRIVRTGREEIAAIGGYRQVRVMGALPHEPEEGEHARPSAEARRERTAAGGLAFEAFEQAVQPVALVVEGVVAGQQFARLREEDYDEPHSHPAGGAVNFFRGRNGGRVVIAGRDFGQRDSRDIRQVLVVPGETRPWFLDQSGERIAVAAN